MIKFVKVLLIIIGLLVSFWIVVNIIPTAKSIEKNPFMSEKTLISAHRGGAHLNPENTKKAFDYVIKETTYTDIVEIDVRTTKEGELVIIHDDTVNRTGINGEVDPVKINNLTYEELTNYNLGVNFESPAKVFPYREYTIEEAKESGLTIMLLKDFLKDYNNVRDFKLYLEVKEDNEIGIEAANKSLALLEEYSWWKDRTMIISFSTAVIDHVADKDSTQLIGALGYKIAPELVLGLVKLDSLYKANYHGFQTQTSNSLGPIKVNCATKSFVKMAHKRNQSITYWTINDENTMKHLIEIGADVITTNSPDVLAKLLGKI